MNTQHSIIRLVAIALIALAAAWACTKEEPAKVAVVTVEDRDPGISIGMLKNATLADMKPDLVAEAGEAKITSADLQSMLQELPQEYLPQLQKNLIFLLEQRVARTILLQEAKAAGVSTEGVSDEEVIQGLANHVAQTATVADEDIAISPRIGVDGAGEVAAAWPLRFFLAGHRYVSLPRSRRDAPAIERKRPRPRRKPSAAK